ncbi:MAG: purine-binding chemotaxis protein CheW [Nitrospirae bacterium]|nr:purine-binding chemotaxis protein CheW [Nitrospirota bacterium]
MTNQTPNKKAKRAKKEPVKKPQLDEEVLTSESEEEIPIEDITEEFQTGETVSDDERIELLAFKLSNEEYVLDISSIKEIIRPVEITKVPRVPSYIKGIISLRGVIAPVYDLKNRLKLSETDAPDDSQRRILIVNFDDELVGIISDAVTGVVKINEDIIEPTPQIIKGVDAEYLKGVARIDNRLLIILNLDRILRKDA